MSNTMIPVSRYGLVGYPLGHSFSKAYFTRKFEREGISAVYDNYEVEAVGRVREIWNGLPDLKGLNVTIPYKESVIPLLDRLDPAAARIGAVNVIRLDRREGKTVAVGYNSDVVGFVRSLQPLLRPHHTEALILGTGGASKAVFDGLQSLGIASRFVSRRSGPAVLDYEAVTPALLERCTVVVNTTPLGMFPHTDEAPSLPYEAFSPRHLAYDLIYNPEETQFLQKARLQGAAVKNGLEMLHGQAEAAWEIWNRP